MRGSETMHVTVSVVVRHVMMHWLKVLVEILMVYVLMVWIFLCVVRHIFTNDVLDEVMVHRGEFNVGFDHKMVIYVRVMDSFVHSVVCSLMVRRGMLSKAMLRGQLWLEMLTNTSKSIRLVWVEHDFILVISKWMVSLMVVSLMETMSLIVCKHAMAMVRVWIGMRPGWLSHWWSPNWCLVVQRLCAVVDVILHGHDELAIRYIHLTGSENGAICIKSCIVSFVPPAGVKGIEVVFPVEVKPVCVVVVSVSLNEIKL